MNKSKKKKKGKKKKKSARKSPIAITEPIVEEKLEASMKESEAGSISRKPSID